MSTQQLLAKKCQPCEGGISPVSRANAETELRQLKGWALSQDGKRIHKEWAVKDFKSGIDFFNRVADLAEEEGHHPDLRLSGYRNISIALSTHAIGGLSENDFILAAKIDQLPIELKKK
jgi:4a-hydroxytetrahydrobiopterin dehydratase